MDPSILKKSSLFNGLTHPQLQKVADIAHAQAFGPGDFVFKEEEVGTTMYIIAEGKIRISKRIPGMGEEALAILDAGDCFGEMALIEGSPRSADAIAHVQSTVWSLERDALDQLMFTDKELAYVLLWTFVRNLSERLRESNDKVKAFFAMSQFPSR